MQEAVLDFADAGIHDGIKCMALGRIPVLEEDLDIVGDLLWALGVQCLYFVAVGLVRLTLLDEASVKVMIND